MKSSPTSRANTGLCRWTLGSPGILPSKTSSIEGCSAAVTETESPSQLRPAVNQRMCTSLTAEARGENLAVEGNDVPPLASVVGRLHHADLRPRRYTGKPRFIWQLDTMLE